MSPLCAEQLLVQGRFWHAHEVWEEQWGRSGDDYYKGLIQLAAGMFHLRRLNFRGARRLLRTCQGYLALRGESPRLKQARELAAWAESEQAVDLSLDALATFCSSEGTCPKSSRSA